MADIYSSCRETNAGFSGLHTHDLTKLDFVPFPSNLNGTYAPKYLTDFPLASITLSSATVMNAEFTFAGIWTRSQS